MTVRTCTTAFWTAGSREGYQYGYLQVQVYGPAWSYVGGYARLYAPFCPQEFIGRASLAEHPEDGRKGSPTSTCRSWDQSVDPSYANLNFPQARGAQFRPSRAGCPKARPRVPTSCVSICPPAGLTLGDLRFIFVRFIFLHTSTITKCPQLGLRFGVRG